MRIIDLDQKHEAIYFVCLEDWSTDMCEASDHKARWVQKMKQRGLRVKLALDDNDDVCGMIEYLPISESIADGHDIYFINCIWVHKHKQGRGDKRKQGFGKALLLAAEDNAKALGAKGMAAYGITLPFWVPTSFFKKQGYTTVDKDGIARLMFKPLSDNVEKPKLIHVKKKPLAGANPGKVTVTFLHDGYCPARNIVYERVKRAVAELSEKVILETIDVSNRETFLAWGMRNELFIENKQINFGPLLSYAKVKRLIEKQIKKL